MNALDVIVLLVAAAAVAVGYRYGFLSRALPWLGLIAGTAIGVLFVDDLANALEGSTPRTRLLASLSFLLLLAIAGQIAGIVVSSVLRQSVFERGVLSLGDRLAGAVAGLLAVLIGVWLLIPAFANAPGWPARAVRGSAVARAVDRVAPSPPGSLATLGRLVGDAPFPEVFDRLTSPDAGPPPGRGLVSFVASTVSASVVKVQGRACDEILQGSGFAVADELVVTNAHVVAGERTTQVATRDGRRLTATVVAFAGGRDLAVLRVPGLGLPPLGRADPEVDTSGAVIGYPGGGPEEESPARIAQRIVATGSDIYRTVSTTRDVLVLAASLRPGDSGGPMLNRAGRVVGVAFAVDPSSETTAYALTRQEIDREVDAARASGATAPVDTGPCLVG